MRQTFSLRYSIYFLNIFQCTYLEKERNFTMEFLDSVANVRHS